LPSKTCYSRKDRKKYRSDEKIGRKTYLLDDLKETRGYCRLKEDTQNDTLWRIRFGRGYGPVVN